MFCTFYGVWGMIFIQTFSNFRKKKFFILFYLIFLSCLCYYCSINVKRQSELSGLRPDTSSLVYFNCTHSKLYKIIVTNDQNLMDTKVGQLY